MRKGAILPEEILHIRCRHPNQVRGGNSGDNILGAADAGPFRRREKEDPVLLDRTAHGVAKLVMRIARLGWRGRIDRMKVVVVVSIRGESRDAIEFVDRSMQAVGSGLGGYVHSA